MGRNLEAHGLIKVVWRQQCVLRLAVHLVQQQHRGTLFLCA
jgi:hypothetical protein